MPLRRQTPVRAWLYLGLGFVLLLGPWLGLLLPLWELPDQNFFSEDIFGIRASWLFGPWWLAQALAGVALLVVACRQKR